jgi:hypothetical protein
MVVSVRDLAQGEFKTDAPKYMDGTFPWTNMKKLADIGVLDDRFHETGIEQPTSMELEVCWWILRLRKTERGTTSWQPGGKRLRW